MIIGAYEIVNIDRQNALQRMGMLTPEFDRAIVYSTTETEPNLLTGEEQPKPLYRGTVVECHEWIEKQTR